MSHAEFLAKPWKNGHQHYERSFLSISPAPEFSTAEVALASLYRASGFPATSENDVAKAGRELDKSLSRAQKNSFEGRISPQGWQTVLHGVLESPKQPKQSSKRFLQLTPIVPDACLYSGSARLVGNSWNPGMLIQRIVQCGARSSDEARSLWQRTFESLGVEAQDDVWARWLQQEFESRRRPGIEWKHCDITPFENDLDPVDKDLIRYPARQFIRDLASILGTKPWMIRRQWVSLLEAIVRLGMVAHVLWLCTCGSRAWRAASAILGRGEIHHGIEPADIRASVLECDKRFLSYGNQAMPAIRDTISGYLESRLALNLLFWKLDELKLPAGSARSASDVSQLLKRVLEAREALLAAGFWSEFETLQASEARTITCRSGIGSNLLEFSRHTLGKRQTATEALRGYDQGYFLCKRSEAPSSPWILSMGPVAALAVVHCCLSESAGPRSIQRLSDHLSWYGLELDLDDISSGELAKKLRMLGLVLDSPDAESGMLLVPPFTRNFGGEIRE